MRYLLKNVHSPFCFRYPFIAPNWTPNDCISMIRYVFNSYQENCYDISRFENEVKNAFDLNFVKAFNSGKSAIDVGLKISGLLPGQEILLPSFACNSILLPVIRNRIHPKYVDISHDLNISVDSIQDNISPDTKAIIVPHIAGKMAPIEVIERIARENNLILIDDSAQAIGAQCHRRFAGSFGDLGIYSLGEGKVIMASAGGVLAINNNSLRPNLNTHKISPERKIEVVKRVLTSLYLYQFRRYTYPFISTYHGIFKREQASYSTHLMSDIDALIGSAQIRRLDNFIAKRRENAKILNDTLSQIPQIICPRITPDHICTNYIIRIELKNNISKIRPPFMVKLVKYLKKHQIEVSWPYYPLHFSSNNNNTDLKLTETIWNQLLALPNNPSLNEEDMKYIGDTVKNFYNTSFK